jgi:MoxR-like ATPase
LSGHWPVFRGDGSVHDGIDELPAPPPWRDFATDRRADEPYRISKEARDRVNAALLLRRPLLVTGKPGTGKSALAYAVARELRLNPVLHWPITSRSTVADGLYHYDALGRLQDSNLPRERRDRLRRRRPGAAGRAGGAADYVTLGALGTAFLATPAGRPRVLLIDEIDKGDGDLAYDLLNVLEEGSFELPELARSGAGDRRVRVSTADPGGSAEVEGALVRCAAFPFIVMTSNGDRPFPPAFLRRCIQLDLEEPGVDELKLIVQMHLQREPDPRLLQRFDDERAAGTLSTDQLLNAVFLTTHGVYESGWSLDDLASAVLQNLESPE